ncbi:Uncharacterized protein SCF082_LOCUS43206, partial [Durusdinium trenchii]
VNGIFERAPYAFNVSYDNLQEEQTYPVIVELDNAYSKVANISYFAEDLNLDNLEGSIEWDHPDEYSKVLVYQVKLQDAAGGSDLLLRANLVQESTNGATLDFSVSDLILIDLDLDEGVFLGGSGSFLRNHRL